MNFIEEKKEKNKDELINTNEAEGANKHLIVRTDKTISWYCENRNKVEKHCNVNQENKKKEGIMNEKGKIQISSQN